MWYSIKRKWTNKEQMGVYRFWKRKKSRCSESALNVCWAYVKFVEPSLYVNADKISIQILNSVFDFWFWKSFEICFISFSLLYSLFNMTAARDINNFRVEWCGQDLFWTPNNQIQLLELFPLRQTHGFHSSRNRINYKCSTSTLIGSMTGWWRKWHSHLRIRFCLFRCLVV